MELNETPRGGDIVTIRQFTTENPAWSEQSLRWLRFNEETNGLAQAHAFIKHGRRVLLDKPAFFRWLKNGNTSRGVDECVEQVVIANGKADQHAAKKIRKANWRNRIRQGEAIRRINWAKIIDDLERAGLSDTWMAKEIGCNKSNISRYKGGTEPLHGAGERLLYLHRITCLCISEVADA